jgi:amino acid adenylation domain-containing protein
MNCSENFDLCNVEKSIPERFERIVQQHPDRIAVKDRYDQCSYNSLNRKANRIARSIPTGCITPDAPVILLMEQGISQITATLGVLKAGCFYVPLDPSNPIDRNRHMLQDSGSGFIITNNLNAHLADALSNSNCRILNVDEITQTSDHNLNLIISPDAFAYVLYTSGSTGRPKGVLQNHRNVLHNVLRHTQAFHITPDDNQTLLYTSSVYGGQRDMFNALLNGTSLNVYDVKSEGIQELADWLIQNDITIYCSVATLFRTFIQTLDNPGKFPKLRLIKLGGEASYKNDIDSCKKYFPAKCIVHCGLSSTETGLVRNYFVNEQTRITGHTVPLGYPIDDLEIILLDDTGGKVPDGNVGEITIRSRYIALGYWRNPSLTQTVFSRDTEKEDVRIYRTGDLGCIRSDGCLEHRGRKDFQIKIKGNRVEVAEIETCLLENETAQKAVVTGWKDHQGIDKLVAYLVSGNNQKPAASALRTLLSKKLPEFMVPSYFIWLDTLPLLPNGKIDRQALPAPDAVEINTSGSYVAPATELESKLSDLWSQILKKPTVGVTDNFFDLGGESLNAVMLFASLEKELGINLPTSVLIKHPTVSSLTRFIEQSLHNSEWKCLIPLKPTGSRPPLFLIHALHGGIIFYKNLLSHLHEEQPLYVLQSHGLNGKYIWLTSIEDVALSYLEEIRMVQPHGPYRLGGYSFGGKLALELARQLRSQGESVSLLVLFDSSPPKNLKRKKQHPARVVISKIKKVASKPKRTFQDSMKNAGGLLKHLYTKLGFTLPVEKREEYLAWHHQRIGQAYQPYPYCTDDILLFCTSMRNPRMVDRWKNYTSGNVIVHRVPCSHEDIFNEPALTTVAEVLNQYLGN